MTNLPCDCCEGPNALTPLSVANRPGLSVLKYRVGMYATFFGTMRSRLSAKEFPELASLRTRENADPSMALLDAWAAVGDVLTFYQERIANEGYLRTATERRSILELARLVGYSLRPGVAATTYLAYTIDKDTGPAEVGKGARVNSIPAPGEQMQAFEICGPLKARPEWSKLKPRMSQPQTRESIYANGLYLKGTATNLKPNDVLLIDWSGDETKLDCFRVHDVTPDNKNDRTLVGLRLWNGKKLPKMDEENESGASRHEPAEIKTEAQLDEGFLDKLKLPPSIQPRNSAALERSVRDTFAGQKDIFPRLMANFSQRLKSTLYPALGNAEVTAESKIKVYAMRVRAQLFGHNALPQPVFDENGKIVEYLYPNLINAWGADLDVGNKPFPVIALDASYDSIRMESWAIIDRPAVPFYFDEKARKEGSDVLVREVTQHKVITTRQSTMGGLGLSATVTLLNVEQAWLTDVIHSHSIALLDMSVPLLRGTVVFAGSEELTTADEPIAEDIGGAGFELDNIYQGFESGQWMIVSGERKDIQGTSGIMTSEPVMLSQAIQDTRKIPVQQRGSRSVIDKPLPGDKLHTFLKFAAGPAYTYQRDTVTLYGNVVKATHGETRQEVLGSGDPTKPFQSFQLKVPGLTHVPAPTASGVQSTLQVWVNGVQWHEAESLAGLGPADRKFITQTGDDGKTTVIFGDGQRGARPPAGVENITATYRSGLGETGNLKGSQISLVATRPLGVKAVSNPIDASGGSDRESRDEARRNTPIALVALDRLVSISDYADFACTFAGIAKASAEQTSGRRAQVKVTVAATNDSPMDEPSELLRNLQAAFQQLGDPRLPISIARRERLALVVSAKVKIEPDYSWEKLEPIVRAALLDAFGFENIELGEDLFLSDALNVMQALPGVVYVNIDTFDTISEEKLLKGFTSSQAIVLKRTERISIGSSQLAYLSSEVPDTLILQEIKS